MAKETCRARSSSPYATLGAVSSTLALLAGCGALSGSGSSEPAPWQPVEKLGDAYLSYEGDCGGVRRVHQH